jgi:hypothetical protein
MSPVVRIEEEYGYRNWIWMPDMSEEEVVAWWKSLSSVGAYFYDGPKDLPGEIHQVYFERTPHDAPEEDHDPAGLRFCLVTNGEGHTLDQMSEFMELPEGAWYMHMHTDNDSILIIDNDERVHHAGYVTDEEYYSDDYEPSPEAAEASGLALHKQIQKIIGKEKASNSDGDTSNDRIDEEYN